MAELRTPEEKSLIVQNCIDIEMAGGSVLDYLAAEGYVTPRATWVNIQQKYLGRKGDAVTDGKETGRKRKGKRPQIRKDALEQDRCEYEISLERGREEGRQAPPEPGKVEVAQEEMDAVGRSALIIDRAKAELDIVMQTETQPKLVVTGIKSLAGWWNMINDHTEDPVLQFVASGGPVNDQDTIVLRVSEWLAVIREFPVVSRMMGVGDGGRG